MTDHDDLGSTKVEACDVYGLKSSSHEPKHRDCTSAQIELLGRARFNARVSLSSPWAVDGRCLFLVWCLSVALLAS